MDSQTKSSSPLDLFQIVTDMVIAFLEQGIVPWIKPWKEAGMPMNVISKRPYRGINLWLLNALNYSQNLFLTWEQVKKLGGSVNKNEKGHVVVFWKSVKKNPEEVDENGKAKTTPMLRYYKVFNISQCTNIPAELIANSTAETTVDPLMECEAILNAVPAMPMISFSGKAAAYYHIENDEITMPKMKNFRTSPAYYSTLFHELVHAAGHEKRLNRKTVTDRVLFGTESYAMEELIAEMGSAFLCQHTGILTTEIKNTVSYIDNWLAVLKKDKRFIVAASGQAQKAVDWILNRQEIDTKEELEEVKDESTVG